MALSDDRATMRTNIGTWGAWMGAFAVAPAETLRPTATAVEAAGYGCIWYPEGMGTRESFTNASVILGATGRIMVASGIANVWARDAVAAAAATRTLNDAHDDRFLLGLGVSHPPQVDPRGSVYLKPVAKMREYLAQLDEATIESPDASAADQVLPPIQCVIAALRPPMLEVARDLALGAHSYLVTAVHTARARDILGADPLLVVEHKAIIETDPAVARERARGAMAWYLGTENYVKTLLWLGFSEEDLQGGGSDRLIDALVAHGDAETVAARLREHLDAGADHVAIQPLGDESDPTGIGILERLGPLLIR